MIFHKLKEIIGNVLDTSNTVTVCGKRPVSLRGCIGGDGGGDVTDLKNISEIDNYPKNEEWIIGYMNWDTGVNCPECLKIKKE